MDDVYTFFKRLICGVIEEKCDSFEKYLYGIKQEGKSKRNNSVRSELPKKQNSSEVLSNFEWIETPIVGAVRQRKSKPMAAWLLNCITSWSLAANCSRSFHTIYKYLRHYIAISYVFISRLYPWCKVEDLSNFALRIVNTFPFIIYLGTHIIRMPVSYV